MDTEEMIWIASIALGKNLDYETLRYSDYMYGKEDLTDKVYEYVDEAKDIGLKKFHEKYSEYKMFI
jgi:hypothetical protein